jgi:hypothetical protein
MRITAVIVSSIALGFVSSTVVAARDEIGSAGVATAQAVRVGNQTSTAELPPPAPQTAQYRVTVFSDWTSTSHPTTRPSNSHFSPVFTIDHSEVGDLFVRGAAASLGIERLAEGGSTSTLATEMAADSTVNSVNIAGSGIFGAGSHTFTVTLSQDAPLISAVTMLAPSPDWFVGIRDQSMFENGTWTSRVERDLANYDSGTDSGSTFVSPDQNTNPPSVVSGPLDPAFIAAAAEGAFGRILIERI